MSFTRRTHIIRIPDPFETPSTDPNSQPSSYIDLEIMDAIAFRIHNNKEVILSMDPTKVDPYIVDDTGAGHGKTTNSGTRRSHMKRIKSSDGKSMLDAEVIDCWSARDQNNYEWVLDMQPGSKGGTAFNVSDGSGDSKSTRRQHTEIVTSPPGKTKSDANGSYVTSIRSDTIAFRKQNNYEVILKCPSCDDPNAQGVDFSRASTFTTPQGYDPNDDSPNAVVPPTLKDSGDKHNYVCFVEDPANPGSSLPIFTGDEKIDMGPFWWIRKIKAGAELACLEVTVQWSNAQTNVPTAFLQTNFGYDILIGQGLDGAPVFNGNAYNGFKAKVMPTDATVKPAIDTVKDMIWSTGNYNTPTGQSGSFTILIWFNVTRIRPLLPKNEPLRFQISLQAISEAINNPSPSGTGYYVWVTGANLFGDGAGLPVPVILPTPTATTGLGVGPNNFTPYAMSYNDQVAADYANSFGFLRQWDPSFHPTDMPGSNPNGAQYGFSTAAGAAAWAAAQNAAQAAEYAAAVANNEFLLSQGIHVDFTGYNLVWDAVTIDYSKSGPPNHNPETCVVNSKFADFTSKTSFGYDGNNQPTFTFPNTAKTNTLVGQAGSPWQTVEYDLDAKRNITVAVSNSGDNPPPQLSDDTASNPNGPAGKPVIPV